MSDHPIEALMKTAMESIKEMVDVNTVVGQPIETADGMVIVPVSRVTAGFAAGGSEYELGQEAKGGESKGLPFGGGSGAGVSVQPVGFLVVGRNQIRLLPVDGNAVVDRLIDLTPQVLERIQEIMGKNKKDAKKEERIVGRTETLLRPQ
ncbi:MAG: GerW family sporulation protein [Thermoanaerobacteraceae bacterium]|uniref:GerW family sporulation protein n=1 Tax=Thermanaeromonas sp. C210 TaxID=2731925 RepID=UPI00155B5EAB|nr:GerW family sporulation protein [Thermanaeromonas sp. C210]MBE3582412.1 GerW family sporulation protein [Thermoanaerobacteraceae bacterium]GFN23439.1 sporulation protein YtfJ [Thermanaeromonas sp. C210]